MWAKINNAIGNFVNHLSLWQFVQSTGVIAAILASGWAAKVTAFFAEYSPFSWVASAILGGLAAAILFAALQYARSIAQIVRLRARVAEANFVNPLDRSFNGRRIRVVDLAPPLSGPIKDRSFVDCDIIGPTNVYFHGCNFHRCGGDAVDAMIVTDGATPRNFFGFDNCSFTNCKFYALTFIVPEKSIADFQRHGWSNLNWLTAFPNVALQWPVPPSGTVGDRPIPAAIPAPQSPQDTETEKPL